MLMSNLVEIYYIDYITQIIIMLLLLFICQIRTFICFICRLYLYVFLSLVFFLYNTLYIRISSCLCVYRFMEKNIRRYIKTKHLCLSRVFRKIVSKAKCICQWENGHKLRMMPKFVYYSYLKIYKLERLYSIVLFKRDL